MKLNEKEKKIIQWLGAYKTQTVLKNFHRFTSTENSNLRN